jgi:hypothetical protein
VWMSKLPAAAIANATVWSPDRVTGWLAGASALPNSFVSVSRGMEVLG